MEGWASWMASAGKTVETIKLRTGHVRKVFTDLDVKDFTEVAESQLVSFLAAQQWKPNTRRSYRASLRGFFAWAVHARLIDHSPAALIPQVPIPRAKPRPIPELPYRSALQVAKYDRQLRIGIRLGGNCGLRRFELAKVHTDDVVEDLVGHALRVTGKGGHERMVPLPDDLADELRTLPRGWLFPSTRIPGRHATAGAVGRWISNALGPGYTTHNLRHRCGTVALMRNGGDLRAVQELLGHAKPETTMIYTLVPDVAVRRAMEAAS